jgi:signal transduction histidine kinase
MSEAAGERRSWVTAYVAGLSLLAVVALVSARFFDVSPGGPVRYWVYLAFLYAVTEYVLTLFHHQSASGRVGISAAEAIILPLIVASNTFQTIAAVALGAAVVSIAHRRSGWLKGIFNVAQFACAAAVASVVWVVLEDASARFSPRDAAAAVLATVTFAVVTHLCVTVAIALAEKRKLWSLSRDVAPATFISLAGNICIGLLLASSWAGRAWTAVFFVLPIGALILGYRAVIRQDQERDRVEKLHDATRALAENVEIEPAILSFLKSVGHLVSAGRSWAVVEDHDGIARAYGVEGDLVVESDQRLLPSDGLAAILSTLRAENRAITVGWDEPQFRDLAKNVDTEDLVAVPIFEDDQVTGCLVAMKRLGAGAFGSEDARLLEALGNELAVTLRARLDKVRAEAEKTALESQLHRAQRLESVGQLAGGIAHDFNNIVSIIVNYSHFVMSEIEDESIREDVAEIKKAADRAAALTRQLLIFSRKEISRPVVLDVNDVVSDLEKLLRRALGESVELQIHLGSRLKTVLADSAQLEQVVLNLALNARDAMPGGGTLRIETSNVTLGDEEASQHLNLEAGRYVRLRVSDSGVGMSEETIERIFEPFFTTKPKGVGTGLGLATAYGVVGQAGGDISVTSRLGSGTSFTIHLPVTEERAELTVTEPDAGKSASGQGETILVVEDEDALRAVARRILSSNGYRVVEASNALEALDQLKNGTQVVDLVLSDIVMPHMSGSELGRLVGEMQPDVGIVYMSGHSNHLTTRSDDDPIPLIQKPFEQGELLDTVRQVLSR